MSSNISMAGMNTQLDIYNMAKVMAQSRTNAKTQRVTREKNNINKELSALNSLSSRISSFYNTLNKYSSGSEFGATSVDMTLDDKAFALAETDEKAVPNTYSLAISQMATRQKVVWASGTTGSATISAGEHTLAVGDKTMTFTVAADSNSLQDVAQQINESGDNPGLTASVMKDGTTSYLTLTAKDSGLKNTLSIDGTRMEGDSLPSGTRILTAAQDARFTLDGVEMSNASNEVTEAITGVTLTLKKPTTEEDGPITINIKQNTQTVKKSVKALVDSFNSIIRSIDSQTKSTKDKDDKPVRATLAGDSMVQSIKRELRDALYTRFDGAFSGLTQIGIMTNSSGSLMIKDSLFKEALEKNPDAITQMFIKDDGLIDGFQQVAAKYIGRPEKETDEDGNEVESKDANGRYMSDKGLLDERIKNLRDNLSNANKALDDAQKRYDDYYQRYLDQFVAMDMAVSKMNSTYNYL